MPQVIVTTPDKPKGRGLKISQGPVTEWAEKRNVTVLQPQSLTKPDFSEELRKHGMWDTFLVASYGKIVPASVFNIPEKGTLNIHPSLLPKFRGPTPLESAILSDTKTGVSIMKIDEQVDHGPIVKKISVEVSDWPPYYKDLEKKLATTGAQLFFDVIPGWLDGSITATEQDHAAATFTKKFLKSDMEINLNDLVEKNLRAIRAFADNGGAYMFVSSGNKNIRVIITRASIENETLKIEQVKPEGKKEMSYEDFMRGLR